MAFSRFLTASLGLGILSLPGVVSAQAQRDARDEPSEEMAQKLQSLLDQVNALRQRLDEQTRVSQQPKSEVEAAAAEGAAEKVQAAAQPRGRINASKSNADQLLYKG